ncbi:hypothetical protein ABZ208_35885 [Streptomyces sp. NPDC006208]
MRKRRPQIVLKGTVPQKNAPGEETIRCTTAALGQRARLGEFGT